mgnify:FL=1
MVQSLKFKPFITIIVAMAQNGVIGQKGMLPWHISEDLKRFKKITLKKPVLMGRKTYDSITERIGGGLPERDNLVLTKQRKNKKLEKNTYFFSDVDQVFFWLELNRHKNLFVAGGSTIYEKFLPMANRIEMTHVHKNFAGDTLFPNWDKKEWRECKGQLRKDTNSKVEFYFSTYNKI